MSPTSAELLAAAYKVDREGTPAQRASTLTILRDPLYRIDSYLDKPARFVKVFMPGVELTKYQAETLNDFGDVDRISVRAPHGVGKSMMMSLAIWWFAITREYAGRDWKIPTTASVHTQLRHFLWPEIHKWSQAFDWERLGRPEFDRRRELLETEIHLAHGRSFALASNNPALIEGAHADSILYVFDESKSIPAGTFDAAEGAFSSAGVESGTEAKALAMSTPGDPTGRFFQIQSCKPGYLDWKVRHVTKEEAIEAGRISVEWVNNRRDQWGETSALFQNRVEGQFHSADEDSVIPSALVEAANMRWVERQTTGSEYRPQGVESTVSEPVRLGVDIARGGADKTMIATLRGRDYFEEFDDSRIKPFEADTMVIAGWVKTILDYRGGHAVIDLGGGYGGGVFDRLRELGSSVIGFNPGAGSDRFDKSGEIGFANLRAEAWWALRETLADPNATLALPPDDELMGDLVTPKWKQTSSGKILIESKDDIRKRIGRSTDKGDAVIMALWTPMPEEIKDPPPTAASSVGGFGDITI